MFAPGPQLSIGDTLWELTWSLVAQSSMTRPLGIGASFWWLEALPADRLPIRKEKMDLETSSASAPTSNKLE